MYVSLKDDYEFWFLEVLRCHFSKSCKSLEKTRAGTGTPFLFTVNLLLTTLLGKLCYKKEIQAEKLVCLLLVEWKNFLNIVIMIKKIKR